MDIFTHDQNINVSNSSLADLNDFPKVTFDTTTDLSGFNFFDASAPLSPSTSGGAVKKEDASPSPSPAAPDFSLAIDAEYDDLLLTSTEEAPSSARPAPAPTLVVTDASSSTAVSLNLPSSSTASPAGASRASVAERAGLVSPVTSSGVSLDVTSKTEQSTAAADSNTSTPNKSFVPCRVCGDKASGYHYGVTSCEGCKGFFRRSIQKQIEYRCLREGKCLVIRLNRNRCQYCRFKKCLAVGMSRDSVRYGRVPKRSRDRPELDARLVSSDDDQSRDIESKQLAIYDVILTVSQAHHAHCSYTEEKTRSLNRRPVSLDLSSVSGSADGATSTQECGEQRRICVWQTIASLLTPSIQRVVEFAKRIPGFLDLSQDDQLILIKASFFEVWLVHASRLVNPLDCTVTFSDGQYIGKHHLDSVFHDDFSSALFSFSVGLNALNLNDTEVALFCSVAMMSADRPGVTDPKLISSSREKLLEALKIQLARNHVSEQNLFNTLLLRLPALQTLGRRHADQLSWYRQRWQRLQLPALFAEIFDIPRHETDDISG